MEEGSTEEAAGGGSLSAADSVKGFAAGADSAAPPRGDDSATARISQIHASGIDCRSRRRSAGTACHSAAMRKVRSIRSERKTAARQRSTAGGGGRAM